MKKLLLIMAAGFVASTSYGQAQSIVFTNAQNSTKGISTTAARPTHAKTTAPDAAWFDYTGLFLDPNGGGGASGFYFAHYQDSNVVGNGSTPYNIGTYGWGQSFDPTDSIFWNGESAGPGPIWNPDLIPAFRVFRGNAYTIDSVAFSFQYRRKTNNDDTLYIQYVKANNTGTNPNGVFRLQFNASQQSFVSGIYDSVTNKLSDSIPAASVITQKILLDQAFQADSLPNGYSRMMGVGFAPPAPISMAAGQVLMIYATVRFSGNYPLGTNEDNANTCRFIGYDISGQDLAPSQSGGSVMAGLSSTKQNKYVPPYTGFTFQGHNMLIPSNAYSTDGRFSDFSFKISCPTCPLLSVNDVKGNIMEINAYPNPAQTEVNVPFSLKKASDVKVTMTNTVGQVVKAKSVSGVAKGEVSFNTGDLANGVYFYTVEANGETKSGRVVVSH